MEKPPYPENTEESALYHVDKALDQEPVVIPAQEMNLNQEAQFLAEQERIAEITRNLTASAKPAQETIPNETAKSGEVNVPEKKSSSTPWWKKTLTAVGITAVGMLPAKEAMSQQHMNSDKEGVKKEIKIEAPVEFHELAQQEMDDWEKYVTYAKALKLDTDPRMNTKAFADKMLNAYIQSHPSTTLSVEKVAQIQQQFIQYKNWAMEKIKNSRATDHEQYMLSDGSIPTTKTFMPNVSPKDEIAGPLTLHGFPHHYETFVHEMVLKGNVHGQDIAYVVNTEKSPLVDEGYRNTTDK